jgi:hypothetical protein
LEKNERITIINMVGKKTTAATMAAVGKKDGVAAEKKMKRKRIRRPWNIGKLTLTANIDGTDWAHTMRLTRKRWVRPKSKKELAKEASATAAAAAKKLQSESSGSSAQDLSFESADSLSIIGKEEDRD